MTTRVMGLWSLPPLALTLACGAEEKEVAPLTSEPATESADGGETPEAEPESVLVFEEAIGAERGVVVSEPEVETPQGWAAVPSGTQNTLRSVWSGAGKTWIVGDSGTVLRFDGAELTAIPADGALDFTAVWGAGSTVYAIAHPAAGGAHLILALDGETWSTAYQSRRHAEPSGPGYYDELDDVWASGPGDVWVVGGVGGAFGIGQQSGVVLHFDGSGWSEEALAYGPRLRRVTGTSSADVWAIGEEQAVMHWDGQVWAPQGSLMGPWHLDGRALSTAQPGEVWASGRAENRFGIYRLHDGTWEPTWVDLDVRAVWAAGGGVVWAAGAGLARWNGSAWEPVADVVESGLLYDVHGSDGDAWAVGLNGAVLRMQRGDV